MAKILSEVELLEKRNSETEKKIDQLTEKARGYIKKEINKEPKL